MRDVPAVKQQGKRFLVYFSRAADDLSIGTDETP